MNALLKILSALKLKCLKQLQARVGRRPIVPKGSDLCFSVSECDFPAERPRCIGVLPSSLPVRFSLSILVLVSAVLNISEMTEEQRCFGALAAGDPAALTRRVGLAVYLLLLVISVEYLQSLFLSQPGVALEVKSSSSAV